MMKRVFLSVVLAGLCLGEGLQAGRLSLPLIENAIARANKDIFIAEGFYKDIKLMAKKELKDEYLSIKERFKKIMASEMEDESFKNYVLESVDRVIEAIDRSGNVRSSDREFMVFLTKVGVMAQGAVDKHLLAHEQFKILFEQMFRSKVLIAFEKMLIEKLELKADAMKRGTV
jgi:hypothetical protein